MQVQHTAGLLKPIRVQGAGQQKRVGHAGGVLEPQGDGVSEAVSAVVFRVAHQKQGIVPQLSRPAASFMEKLAAQATVSVLQPDAQVIWMASRARQ